MKWFGSRSARYALATAGGKDATLALQRARRDGLEVTTACTLFDVETRRIRIHGIEVDLVERQAEALGLDFVGRPTTPEQFETDFTEMLSELKGKGIRGVVFGNVHLDEIRRWYEDRTRSAGLKHVEPLWGERPEELAREVVASGYRAIVVSVNLEAGNAEWLGRELDIDLLAELERNGIDPCGEHGEYRTFVWDGPEFRAPVDVRRGDQREEEGHLVLDLRPESRSP